MSFQDKHKLRQLITTMSPLQGIKGHCAQWRKNERLICENMGKGTFHETTDTQSNTGKNPMACKNTVQQQSTIAVTGRKRPSTAVSHSIYHCGWLPPPRHGRKYKSKRGLLK